jgi:hypothetical protein
MKRLACFFVFLCFVAPCVIAQDHVEVGAFADYFRLNDTSTNFGGLGGRASVNIWPMVQLEAEMSYDFDQTFVSGFTSSGTGSVTVDRAGVHVLHGLFGPKLQTNKGPVRLFVTAKGGFVNFMVDSGAVTPGTFANGVENLSTNNVDAVFYPGGGAEAFWGPIGLRVDVGDEIYFNNGARNNLRVTFGPTIRF